MHAECGWLRGINHVSCQGVISPIRRCELWGQIRLFVLNWATVYSKWVISETF